MRKYQAIIFDFDGTLIDSAPGIVLSLAELLKTMGREPLPEERLRACVGPPIVQFFPEYLGFHGEELDRAMITYREIFNKTALGMPVRFPRRCGALEGYSAFRHAYGRRYLQRAAKLRDTG